MFLFMRIFLLMTIFTMNGSLYSKEYGKPTVEFLLLSPEEAESHSDADIQLHSKHFDPGHFKTLLSLKNFPIDKLITFSMKRPLEKGTCKESGKFFVNSKGEIVSPKDFNTLTLLLISSRGFLPGERIICRFAGKNGFEIETTFIPNPIKASNQAGTVTIEAELISLVPAYYRFFFTGFQEDEVLDYVSISGKEKITKTIKITAQDFIASSPDVLGKRGGVGRVTFIRKSGEIFQLDLPWGIDFIDYRKGNKVNDLSFYSPSEALKPR